MVRPLALLSILIFAAVTDAMQRKVYNNLILTGFITETAVCVLDPVRIDAYSLVYMAAFLAVLFVFYFRKMLGGADLKLYMLTMFTYPNTIGLALITASIVSAAVYALFTMQVCRNGRHAKLPMGIFILIGALFAIFKG